MYSLALFLDPSCSLDAPAVEAMRRAPARRPALRYARSWYGSMLLCCLVSMAWVATDAFGGSKLALKQSIRRRHPPTMASKTASGAEAPGSERVLVIGSSGREYTIVETLLRSQSVAHVFVAPGNAGTSLMSPRVSSVSLPRLDADTVGGFARAQGVGLVVVGPEAPLVAGLADGLKEQGLACFGCSAKAAEIEGSKAWSKAFMQRHGIPTAAFEVFEDYDAAAAYVRQQGVPIVVKASGLAAGKGAVVAHTLDQALQALDDMMNKRVFGLAGSVVVVEACLQGDEVSLMAFSDGTRVACMPPARDYKRLLCGDNGPNTGGMGAIAPVPGLSPTHLSAMQALLQQTVSALAQEGRPFVGVLYGGFMLPPRPPLEAGAEVEDGVEVGVEVKGGPQVLEFNCRMGDPETQSVLSLLDSDLLHIMKQCVAGELRAEEVTWQESTWAVTVVGASAAYPGPPPKDTPFPVLHGLSHFTATEAGTQRERDGDTEEQCVLTHAGTSLDTQGQQVLATGGRVLSVTGLGPSLRRAIFAAYRGLSLVQFEGMTWRADIGEKAAGDRHGGPLRVGILGSTRGSSVRPLIASSSPISAPGGGKGGGTRREKLEKGAEGQDLDLLETISTGQEEEEEEEEEEEGRVVLVLSDVAGSGLLTYAQEQGVPSAHVTVDRKAREDGEREVDRRLREARVDVLLLNGYGKVLSPWFVRRWYGRCLNLHPSLLPRHAGLFDRKVHEAVLRAGEAESGCTVHLVSEEVDDGPILLQLTCPVGPRGEETIEGLRRRVQALEGSAWARALGVYRRRTSEIAEILMRNPLPPVE